MKKLFAILSAACLFGGLCPQVSKPNSTSTAAAETVPPAAETTTWTTSEVSDTLPPMTNFRENAEYDFEAYFGVGETAMRSCYVGQESILNEIWAYLYVHDPLTGKYIIDMVPWKVFYDNSSYYADYLTFDISAVDFDTAGTYDIVIRSIPDGILELPVDFKTPYGLPRGKYRFKMGAHESVIKLTVMERPKTLLKQTECTLNVNGLAAWIEFNNPDNLPVFATDTETDSLCLKYSVADADIVELQYNWANECFYLWGLKEGTTTFTLITPDGTAETCTVVVGPEVVRETEITTLPPNEIYFSITTLPDKLTYQIGEELDFTGGLACGAGRIDGVEFDVFDQPFSWYQIDASDYDNQKPGKYEIRLTYSCEGLQKTVSYEVTVVNPTEGDANLDGQADISDVILIARYAAEDNTVVIPPQGLNNADANYDGRLTVADVVQILQKIAKL